jgi:hypothetical protein
MRIVQHPPMECNSSNSTSSRKKDQIPPRGNLSLIVRVHDPSGDGSQGKYPESGRTARLGLIALEPLPTHRSFGAAPVTRSLYQLESGMMMSRKSLLRRFCCGIFVAALLLAISFDGSRSARAADPDALTPLLETIITPIITTIQGAEHRLSVLEGTLDAFADSFTSRRVVAQTLCVSDESGAQTCITKAELDFLLKRVAQADISQPSDVAVSSGIHAEVAQPLDTTEVDQPSDPVTEANALPAAGSVESVNATEPPPPAPTSVQASVLLSDQDPEYTGTVTTSSSGAAVVLHPEIEISIVPGARSDD